MAHTHTHTHTLTHIHTHTHKHTQTHTHKLTHTYTRALKRFLSTGPSLSEDKRPSLFSRSLNESEKRFYDRLNLGKNCEVEDGPVVREAAFGQGKFGIET
jgi:hypothetical protein